MPALPTCSAGAANPRAAQGRGGRRGRNHGRHTVPQLIAGNAQITEAPLGEDKSKPRRTEPSDLSAAPRGEQWKSRNDGRRKKPRGMSPGDPQGHCGGDG